MSAGPRRLRLAPAMLPVLFALAACSAVELPVTQFYRLDVPVPASAGPPRPCGVLRVLDLQLANNLAGDCLLVADGPVRVMQSELHRWVAPLDRLATDAVVRELARSRMFERVLGGGDPGQEQLTLGGRILDFHEQRGGAVPAARVTLELWLLSGERQLLQREFGAERPLVAGGGPEALVQALSQAFGSVLDQFASEAATVLAAGAEAVPGR